MSYKQAWYLFHLEIDSANSARGHNFSHQEFAFSLHKFYGPMVETKCGTCGESLKASYGKGAGPHNIQRIGLGDCKPEAVKA